MHATSMRGFIRKTRGLSLILEGSLGLLFSRASQRDSQRPSHSPPHTSTCCIGERCRVANLLSSLARSVPDVITEVLYIYSLRRACVKEECRDVDVATGSTTKYSRIVKIAVYFRFVGGKAIILAGDTTLQ